MEKTKLFFMMLAISIFTACSKDSFLAEIEKSQTQVVVQEKDYTTEVSIEDVMYLAKVFNAGQAQTKNVREVENISTLVGENGEPAIYVINYADNQGFVLVSATKNYHPILAYNTNGYFNLWNKTPDALTEWIERMKRDIDYANQLPADSTFKYRTAWGKFEKDKSFNPQVMTRSVTNSVLDSYVMPMVSQWIQDGVEYHSLEEAAAFLPSDVYARFLANAENSIFPLYDYMNYTFVVINDVSNNICKKINFRPLWHQNAPYNNKFPIIDGKRAVTGCGVIAMAQIMRFHEYPTDENLQNMAYSYNSTQVDNHLSDFIYKLSGKLNAVYGKQTTVTMEKIEEVFKDTYQYNAKMQSHNISDARSNIDQGYPVIMAGKDSTGGHGWIVSGYDWLYGHREYQLWVPVNNAEITEPYSVIDTYSDSYYSYTDIYIHWGWGGDSDGYFLDSNISLGFNNNRKDIINIYPK